MIRPELPRTRSAGWSLGSCRIKADEDSPLRGIHAAFGAAVQSEVICWVDWFVYSWLGSRRTGASPGCPERTGGAWPGQARTRRYAGGRGGMGLIHAALPSAERLVFGFHGNGPDEPQ